MDARTRATGQGVGGAKVGAEGNAVGPHGAQAQDRAAFVIGDRPRTRERKGEKFTTQPHHIDASLLQQAITG